MINVSALQEKNKDTYAQLAKNTVRAEAQLKETECVRFHSSNGTGIRVMFVGNSITLHGVLPSIGWHSEWGMAASEKEKDYVHLLEADIKKIDPEAAFCICQVAGWECDYKNGREKFSLYNEARNFCADVIILRFIDNVKKSDYDSEIFLRELDMLVKHLDGTGKAKCIITTGFWKHPGDDDICMYARKKGIPCVELGDLGENDRMKAIGLFEHSGVANHPGDEGMRAIADRIMEVVHKQTLL